MPTPIGHLELLPSARRLMGSLRDIGYDFPSAVADLVDNSIAAGASRVVIDLNFSGMQSWLRIVDDGSGMNPSTLNEAMRFGTRRLYNGSDLGRFGLGLKTASISQSRRVTVATRQATKQRRIHVRRLDLDYVEEHDRWEVESPPGSARTQVATEPLHFQRGTVVVWEKIDRVLEYRNPEGGWARKRFERLAAELSAHLGMVFHRFLAGEVMDHEALSITLNGSDVVPWDPFARSEPATLHLPGHSVAIDRPRPGMAKVTPYVLPHRSAFSSPERFEALSGPLKWNRQQGLYMYRADRLVQGGGWAGIRSVDEHTKYARVAVDFSPELDELFKINVAKMSVTLPSPVRKLLEPRVAEVCRIASERYRRGELDAHSSRKNGRASNGSMRLAGIALQAAAMETGDTASLERIASTLRTRNRELAEDLGL